MRISVNNFTKKNILDRFLNRFLYQTRFSILFPRYQEKYIKESWLIIQRIIAPYGLFSKLDTKNGHININTTHNTRDPFVIFKARDFLKLISRSVPVYQAAKIFDDQVYCDIIKISGIISNRNRFLKRRKRLIGTNGITIKAIELVTQCYVLVQGNTVSCMGKHSGIKKVRKIVIDCIQNIHPVIHIKSLIIKNDLMKDDRFKNQTWEKFITFPTEKKDKFLNLIQFKGKNKNKADEQEVRLLHESREKISEFKIPSLYMENQFLKSYSIIPK